MSHDESRPPSLAARIGLVLGPLAAILLAASPSWGWALDPARPELNNMAAVAVLMAIWWLTEAIPMAVTALAPVALFPLLGIMSGVDAAASYASPLIFLFLGGFLVALAIEESGLHRRVALSIVSAMGDNPRRIVLGFMLATGGLSMWLSNTATTMMMLPIAASVLAIADQQGGDAHKRARLGVALMLGVAYSASIGGAATLIGTPTNVAFVGVFKNSFPEAEPPTFAAWMLVAAPFSVTFLIIAWGVLAWIVFPVGAERLLGGSNVITEKRRQLGPMSAAEKRTAVIFATTAALWVFREPVEGVGWALLLEHSFGVNAAWISDGTVATAMALVCFATPRGDGTGRRLIEWQATQRLPWGILLLLGGGFALADGLSKSGLDQFLGQHLAGLMENFPELGMSAACAFGMTWLTELTSNVASVQMLTPILADTATALNVNPLMLMIPATLASSCAFMLPVATPPNAIVYGSGRVQVSDMIKAGIWLNLIGVVWVTLIVWFFLPLAFG